jgi:hypothetical protein
VARRKHVCFKCGTPTETTIQTRERKGRTYICPEARCWTAYYKLVDGE